MTAWASEVLFLQQQQLGEGGDESSSRALQTQDRTLDILERLEPAMDRLLGLQSQLDDVTPPPPPSHCSP